ncbi:MAG: Gfo/Idh/MocA family oxidoreductase [Pirellulales bacterium]|nr:Gfo/Idh/MocA family oxidoreductase [Pirellulales bacterium]
MTDFNRRRFLEKSMFATATALAATASTRVVAAADNAPSSPNEKLGVAILGVRGRGGEHIEQFAKRPNTQILYLVDPDSNVAKRRASQVKELSGHEPKVVQDMREVFDDKTIDVVSVATPNHWHSLASIWAMQAGKDVYCEKPVSHNVSEGRRMVEVARKHQRICQTGTQIRSTEGTNKAMAYLHDGKLGDVTVARGLCYKRRPSIGHQPDKEPPAGVDYNLWLGPAPERAFSGNRFHYNWHWHWDYGNGDLGNQGIHQMDVARWGLNVDNLGEAVMSYGGRFGYEDDGETANTQITMHTYGNRLLIFEVRGLETPDFKGAKVGNVFYGTKGYLVMTDYSSGAAFDLDGKLVEKFDGGGDHFGNFIDCVLSRKQEDLHADILEGHLSSALCHLGNISYRLGQKMSPEDVKAQLSDNPELLDSFTRFSDHLTEDKVNLSETQIQCGPKLAFDAANEKFANNSQADAMLTREYRAPFVVPSASQI